jgi:pimeloyl-ACP methyl ester carboxylesterase
MAHLTGLPDGVRSRFVDGVNGLRMHVLEAGEAGRPALLLLHGFPELAWSWRKVMPALAAAGYHVVAPDQRGYGGTTGCDTGYDADTGVFRQMRLAGDMVALLAALGITRARAVVGHDFGSSVAAHLALARPDLFEAVVLMSAPFPGAPSATPAPAGRRDMHADLAALPRPRRHYQWYYSTREAAEHMLHPPQGLHDFLRAYFHVKSADWPGNRPRPLPDASAATLAELPDYYLMPLGATMPEAVAADMPDAAAISACSWLPDEDLEVYVREFGRTGFQGGLNWYRRATDGSLMADLRLFAGRRIAPPAIFIAGAADWGVHQSPGAFDAMRTRACADFRGATLIEGAGHWVQIERPEAVTAALLDFIAGVG